MSNEIPPLGLKDRSSLNIRANKEGKKKWIILIVVLCSIVIVILGVSVTISKMESALETEKKEETDDNYQAGKVISKLERNDSSWLTEMRRLKAEKDKIEVKEELKPEAEVATKPKPIPKVQSETKIQPPPKPKPRVVRNGGTPPKPPEPEPNRKLDPMITVSGQQSTINMANASASGSGYSDKYSGSKYSNGSASVRKSGSLDFLLRHGTSIPCAIYTQIISDYEGYVTCQVTRDIYSSNGKTLLVEKGSLVSGEQSVALDQGQARAFTTWSDIETPYGISIQVDSLGTGPLGAAGVGVWVDKHYSERFGGAIMLSFVDDALATLSDRLKQQGNVTVDNSTDNASDMASKALESSINIKPTGYSYIGQRINILLARDVDMSNVYLLEDEW